MKYWYLYVAKCADDTLYTGITTDINRRMHEHNNTKRGAKYTRARRPVELVCVIDRLFSRSIASQYEIAFKKLSRKQKQSVIALHNQKPIFKKNDIVLVKKWHAKNASSGNWTYSNDWIVGVVVGNGRLEQDTLASIQFAKVIKYSVLINGSMCAVPEYGLKKADK